MTRNEQVILDPPIPARHPPPSKTLGGPPSDHDPPGDPFGSTDGRSELHKANDPWPTEVQRALDDMPVGTFGTEGEDVDLQVPPRGLPRGRPPGAVQTDTGDPALDTRIENATETLQVNLLALLQAPQTN